MDSLLTLSATQLAARIKNREVSSQEAVETHIAYAQKVNPVLNAIVIDRFDAARREAAQADVQLKTSAPETLPEFHGVPCTIKECFGFTGFPQTSGMVSRKNTVATKDATSVARIRAAGAIPIGITNVPELCMWMETSNNVYGRTNNPYDPARIVGGSSGGEGAIIGSGASPFGLGSDVGGSIRMPAFFNGVFGHKPSSGLIPNSGQFPIASDNALKFLGTGPIARRAEDLYPLVRLLAGPDQLDVECNERDLHDPHGVDVAKLTVVNVENNGAIKMSPDLVAAQKKVAEYLARKGATVKNVSIARLKHSFDIWSSMLSAAGGESFGSMMGGGKPILPAYQLLRWMFRASPHTLPAIILALLEPVAKLTPKRTQRFVDEGLALQKELADLIGEGIMLFPSYSRPAPEHNKPLLTPFDWTYTAIINVMELPATQVPLGLNAEGLPLGVQVIGKHGNDHVTLAVALELEKAFGGWTPPKTLTEELRQKVVA